MPYLTVFVFCVCVNVFLIETGLYLFLQIDNQAIITLQIVHFIYIYIYISKWLLFAKCIIKSCTE